MHSPYNPYVSPLAQGSWGWKTPTPHTCVFLLEETEKFSCDLFSKVASYRGRPIGILTVEVGLSKRNF